MAFTAESRSTAAAVELPYGQTDGETPVATSSLGQGPVCLHEPGQKQKRPGASIRLPGPLVHSSYTVPSASVSVPCPGRYWLFGTRTKASLNEELPVASVALYLTV